jgi:hypothetical protein
MGSELALGHHGSVEPEELTALVDRLLVAPMSEELVVRVSALGRRLIAVEMDPGDARDVLDGSPWAAISTWGDLPLGEQPEAGACVGLIGRPELTGDELAALSGAIWERGRLLDGLARRCGINVAEARLGGAGWWQMVYRVGSTIRRIDGPRLSALLGVRDRADRARLRDLAGSPSATKPGFEVNWCAELSQMVDAQRVARDGGWVEMSWQRPVISMSSVGIPLREKQLKGPITFRLEPDRVAAVRPADPGQVRTSPAWRARVLPVLHTGWRGVV